MSRGFRAVASGLPGFGENPSVGTGRPSVAAGTDEVASFVASREPLGDLERDLASLPRAEEGRQVAHAPAGEHTKLRLRGMGAMVTTGAPAPKEAGGWFNRITGALVGKAQKDSGIWTWQIEVENPAQ